MAFFFSGVAPSAQAMERTMPVSVEKWSFRVAFPLSGQRLPEIDTTYIVCIVDCGGLSVLLGISS
jgi:hypothetical protein